MASTRTGRLSLRHNFLWIFAGSLVENGAKWAMFIALTKTVSSQAVGTFSLALAVATPITILAQLQLRVALITDARGEHAFSVYHGLRLITMCVSMAVLAVVATSIYGPGTTSALILLIGAAQAVVSLRDIWVGLAQKHERMDVTARGNMLDGVLSLALFAAALRATGSVLWAAGGMIAARLLVLLLYDIRAVRSIIEPGVATRPAWQPAALRRLVFTVLPLGLTTFLVSLNSNVPRYFIEHWVGRDDLGYFAAIAYFVFAAQLIIASLSRAASPRLAILYHQNRRSYGALLGKLVGIGAVLAVLGVLGAALVGEHFLRIVYSPEYAERNHILVLLMGAGGLMFVNSFFGVAISAARFFAVQTATYVAVVTTTLIACAVLIPRWGLEGAAWSAIISAAINTAINGAVVVHVYRHKPAPSP